MSAALGFVVGKKRPEGDWKACTKCGTTGVLTRVVVWHGTDPQRESERCGTCEGGGWVPAPWYYRLPHSQWPAGALD